MSKPRVLIVEDEEKIAALERDYLNQAGFEVDVLYEGGSAVAHVEAHTPDLLVLDLMLPGEDGLSICKRVRGFSDVPIIMVTARVDEIDRLLGLELGADDYLCKPFSPRELVLRVRAILRRSAARDGDKATSLNHGSLALDGERHSCTLAGQHVELTPVEFRLLEALMKRPGRVLSRQQLMDVAYEDHRVVSDRTIDSHMRNLRQKLGDAAGAAPASEDGNDDPSQDELIRSIYGVGYAMN